MIVVVFAWVFAWVYVFACVCDGCSGIVCV